MKNTEHRLLLVWLIMTGLVLFAIVVCWQEGFLNLLYSSDQSYISLVISAVYVLFSIHIAHKIWYLSSQHNFANQVDHMLTNNPSLSLIDSRVYVDTDNALPESFVSNYVGDLLRTQGIFQTSDEGSATRADLLEVYAGKLKGPHEIGWFIVEIMIKLGLLGTIVGFIMMLGSVADTATIDVNTMQKVLQQMSVGMGTALYTTLTGLTGSMLLAAQYHMLDRSADELIEKTIHLAEVHILPTLVTTTAK